MDMHAFLILLAGQVAGYLVGGIPFAYLVARWKTGRDIRTIGSGNVGATNVGRLLGFHYFILVFALDFAKGALPVLAAQHLSSHGMTNGPHYLPEVVGFAAILGHVFPIYLGMKGGKGVATTIGVLLCLVTWPTLAGLGAFILLVLLTRMISAGSIAFAVTFAVVYQLITAEPWGSSKVALSSLVMVLAALVILKHSSNVKRIISGTEPKISLFGSRKRPDESAPSDH